MFDDLESRIIDGDLSTPDITTDPLEGWEASAYDTLSVRKYDGVMPESDTPLSLEIVSDNADNYIMDEIGELLFDKISPEINSDNDESIKMVYNLNNTEQTSERVPKVFDPVLFKQHNKMVVPAFVYHVGLRPGIVHIFSMSDSPNVHKNCQYDPTGSRAGSWHWPGETAKK